MTRRLAIAMAALAVGLVPAAAQDFSLDPTFGETSLNPGYETYSINLVAGGDLFASETIGGDCFGLIADAPDFRIQFESDGSTMVISAISNADTTLVINDPNGEWFCNDDFQELNPAVFFDNPLSGQYDVWVGTFGDTADADLYVDEYAIGDGPVSGDGSMPDFGLDPAFGEMNLAAGFEPVSIALIAGGGIDAQMVGDNCWGMIATAPDYRVQYDGGGDLNFAAMSDDDTTLVINAPDAAWYCDDDSNDSFNPSVMFSDAMPGQYDIWVGTFFVETAEATLEISGGATRPRK